MCVDPERRLTCKEALGHPWVSGGGASERDIHSAVSSQLSKHFARKNWRKAYNATAAIRMLKQLSLSGQQGGSAGGQSSGGAGTSGGGAEGLSLADIKADLGDDRMDGEDPDSGEHTPQANSSPR